ncbi:hypothetical protein K435DRAFT_389778 [Dendrothele bispora CBS 962.96]|uniref:Uncharacterized protein n=1 Tax=Dendrothele bispora (strain CBS 962.96) TaxID=1314807 RepID=A0A4S8L9Z1_DENBC|nr:hypothetical protein K435DRAFT_389778 [Dendrothele bispora CBS 962.96]
MNVESTKLSGHRFGLISCDVRTTLMQIAAVIVYNDDSCNVHSDASLFFARTFINYWRASTNSVRSEVKAILPSVMIGRVEHFNETHFNFSASVSNSSEEAALKNPRFPCVARHPDRATRSFFEHQTSRRSLILPSCIPKSAGDLTHQCRVSLTLWRISISCSYSSAVFTFTTSPCWMV